MFIRIQSHRREQPFLWELIPTLGLSIGLLLVPDLAFATMAADRPADSLGCILTPTLSSGDAGKALAAIIITVLNVGALLGKITWGMALLLLSAPPWSSAPPQ